MRSDVTADDEVDLQALADQAIDGHGVLGVGRDLRWPWSASRSLAPARRTENKIAVDVDARIGDETSGPSSTIAADEVLLTARDSSIIEALSGTAVIAAALTVVGAQVSVAVTIARNEITSKMRAYIVDADVQAGPGGVAVKATNESRHRRAGRRGQRGARARDPRHRRAHRRGRRLRAT